MSCVQKMLLAFYLLLVWITAHLRHQVGSNGARRTPEGLFEPKRLLQSQTFISLSAPAAPNDTLLNSQSDTTMSRLQPNEGLAA